MTRKEAIEKIRKWDFLNDEEKEAIEVVCPELKESEDEKIVKHLITLFTEEYGRNSSARFAGIKVKDILAWLEKQGEQSIKMRALLSVDKLASAEMTGRLKERKEITDNPEKYGLCKKSAWSEEDEKHRNAAICACSYMIENFENSTKIYEDANDWLKSLKPQPQWKPSEGQLIALDEVYKTHGANNVCRRIIFNLLEQLKKL